jgi:hypothetical protein
MSLARIYLYLHQSGQMRTQANYSTNFIELA